MSKTRIRKKNTTKIPTAQALKAYTKRVPFRLIRVPTELLFDLDRVALDNEWDRSQVLTEAIRSFVTVHWSVRGLSKPNQAQAA